ncbi:DUF6666 family protein [Allorhodopirellula solitaria]|nr:DUF6666 family protein [Allorhodopirellula solitaria]
MLATDLLTKFTLASDGRFVGLARVLAAIACVSTASAADTYSRQQQASTSMAWSPARVSADASAVVERAPQLVPRSSAQRTSLATNTAASPQRQASGEVQQVGFLEDYGAHSSVCDCQECASYGPNCGMEGGYLVEPDCGLESQGGYGPACGIEPGCGLEPLQGDPCGCDACSSGIGACEHPRFPLFLPVLGVDWSRFEFYFGSQAFLNPLNVPSTGSGTNANSGSFGFHQGFNEGRDLKNLFGADLSAQLGLRATQNNLEGQHFTDQHRNQIFITGGLFRRVDYGLQYGLVLDYLNEDWYYHADLLQLRGELSWKLSRNHNFGFRWMAGLNDDTVPTIVNDPAGALFAGTQTATATDQYRAFYRYCFGPTAQWTSYIGGTDSDHFLIGSDMDVPLKGGISMKIASTYFAPTGDTAVPKYQAEGWNLGISMVYRPGCRTSTNRYLRPMFNVADNGSFFVTK